MYKFRKDCDMMEKYSFAYYFYYIFAMDASVISMAD